jgi:hypothetical protein
MSKKEEESPDVSLDAFESALGKLEVATKNKRGHGSSMTPSLLGKPRATDEELLYIMKQIAGKDIPLKMLPEFIPFKMELDEDGNFLNLPGSLKERLITLGYRVHYRRFIHMEHKEEFIRITLHEISADEKDKYLEKKRNRVRRHRARQRSGGLLRIVCKECNATVRVGVADREIKVFCKCMETPKDSPTIELPDNVKDKWNLRGD